MQSRDQKKKTEPDPKTARNTDNTKSTTAIRPQSNIPPASPDKKNTKQTLPDPRTTKNVGNAKSTIANTAQSPPASLDKKNTKQTLPDPKTTRNVGNTKITTPNKAQNPPTSPDKKITKQTLPDPKTPSNVGNTKITTANKAQSHIPPASTDKKITRQTSTDPKTTRNVDNTRSTQAKTAQSNIPPASPDKKNTKQTLPDPRTARNVGNTKNTTVNKAQSHMPPASTDKKITRQTSPQPRAVTASVGGHKWNTKTVQPKAGPVKKSTLSQQQEQSLKSPRAGDNIVEWEIVKKTKGYLKANKKKVLIVMIAFICIVAIAIIVSIIAMKAGRSRTCNESNVDDLKKRSSTSDTPQSTDVDRSQPSLKRGTIDGCWKPRHKTGRLGVYYSEKLLRRWSQTSKSWDPTTAIMKLLEETNKWFTPEKLGYGNKVEFTLTRNNIRKISDDQVSRFWTGNTDTTIFQFCDFARRIKAKSENWQYIVLLVSERKENLMGVSGLCAAHGGFCSKTRNCILVLDTSPDPSTIHILPQLLVHELGHSIGLYDLKFCEENGYERCTETSTGKPPIMGMLYLTGNEWAYSSKYRINEQFKDINAYPCMKWECGQSKPNDMLSDPKKKAILDKMCDVPSDSVGTLMIYNIRLTQLQVHEMKAKDDIQIMLKKNPRFYKEENVCKGIVCVQKKECIPFCRYNAIVLKQESLTSFGSTCGENKICQYGQCVAKSRK